MINRSVFVVIAPTDGPGMRPRSEPARDAFACGVLTYDNDGTITYASETARTLLQPILGVAERFTAFVPGVVFLRGDGSAMTPQEFPVLRTLLTGVLYRGERLGIRNERGETLWIHLNTALQSQPVAV